MLTWQPQQQQGLTHWQGSAGHTTRVLNMLACLQGPLPAWPSSGHAMPALQFLMLDSNWNLTGQLSAQWGSLFSMGRLSVLSARDCNLGGTLPPSWPTQLPELQVIDLTNNLVMGENNQSPQPPKQSCTSLLCCPQSRADLCPRISWQSKMPFAMQVTCHASTCLHSCRNPARRLELLQLAHDAQPEEQQPHRHPAERVSPSASCLV